MRDFEDFANDPSMLAQVSWEAKPGPSTNHLPQIHSAPKRQQEAYHRAIMRALEDENGISRVLRHFGLLETASVHGLGFYKPSTGEQQGQTLVSPGTQFRAIAPVKMGGGRTLDEATVQALDAASATLAIATQQEAVPWHAAIFDSKLTQEGARIADARFSEPLTNEQQVQLADAVTAAMERNGLSWEVSVPIPGPTGLRFLDIGGIGGTKLKAVLDEALASVSQNSEVVYSAGQLGTYVENNWGERPDGQGHLEAGSGGRSDVSDSIRLLARELLPRTQRVADLAAELYGWTPNRALNSDVGWNPATDPDFDAQVRDILQSGLAEAGAAAPERGGAAPAEEPLGAAAVFDEVLERPETLFQGEIVHFPADRARRPHVERAKAILEQARSIAAQIRTGPRIHAVDDPRGIPALERRLAELRAEFNNTVTLQEAVELAGRPEVAAGAPRGGPRAEPFILADLDQRRAQLQRVEADRGWRFDPEKRGIHEDLTEMIGLLETELAGSRGLEQRDVFGARGVAQFAADGRAVIRGLTNPDLSTAIHELTHVARRQLDDVSRTRLERIYGVKDGVWTREAEERFASDAEQYFQGLREPPKLARPIFERVKESLRKLWDSVTGRPELANKIDPQVRRFFEERILEAAGVEAKAPPLEGAVAAGARAVRQPRGPPLGIVAEQPPEELVDLLEPGVVTRFFRKYATKESLAPESAYQLYETARSGMRADVLDAKEHAQDWYRAEKKSEKPKEDRAALSRYLHGNTEALAEISTIEGRRAAGVMRAAIDRVQDDLLRSGMIEPGSQLETVIKKSIGTYLRRQYRAFREPGNWDFETIRKKHPEILANAVKYVEGVRLAGGMEALPKDRIEGLLADLFPGKGERENPFALLDKVGRKDLSVFMKKKDVPEAIRKLLGEFDDPVVNFLQTYQHVAGLVTNHKMLSDLKDVGVKQGWLVPSGEATGDMNTELVPDSASYSPLAGMRTTPDIADAWERLTKMEPLQKGIGRWYLHLMGIARATKTVFNIPSTHIGNIAGNYPLMLANGNWGAFGAKNPEAWKIAWHSAFGDLYSSDAKTRAFASKLTRLGVTNTSVGASEFRDLVQEAGGGDLFGPGGGRAGARKVMSAFRRVFRIYGAEDDGPKVLSYLMEYAKYKQIYPNLPEAQLERMVADIVQDTMPTWSRINPLIRKTTRRIPFGNFVSFPLEIMRTRFNALNLAKNEMKQGEEMRTRGKETGNHELEGQGRRLYRAGARRMVSGIVVPGFMFESLSALSKWLWGIDDEEEEKLSRGFAPWERYSPKWYLSSPAKGKVSFIDLGGMNPFGSLTKPIKAVTNNLDDFETAMRAGLGEFLRPFADTDFMARLVIEGLIGREYEETGLPELIEGKKPRPGAWVWKPDAPDNLARIGNRIAEEISLYKFGKRLHRSLNERISESGQATGPWQEILGQFTRLRPSNRDWLQTLQFRRDEYDDDLRDARTFFTSPAQRRGAAPSEREIRRGFHRFVEQTIERSREIVLDIEAARAAGTDDDEIFTVLTDPDLPGPGLSKKRAEELMGATIVVAIPSTEHGDPLLEGLTETAGDIVASYGKKYKQEGLTIELE